MSKTLEAVFSPQKFTPALMAQADRFTQHWVENRPWVLANMAHIAYFEKTAVLAFTAALGARQTSYYDVDGAQAFLALWGSHAILSFRGSQPMENLGEDNASLLNTLRNLSPGKRLDSPLNQLPLSMLNNDVLADINLIKVPFDASTDVKVHQGFLQEINKLWDVIDQDLQLCAPDIPVWVTGHSLGAAMATLAGMRHPFEEVVTYGEPRVGRGIGRAFKAKGHSRFVNGRDPVTMIPPEKPFNYDHHGVAQNIGDADGGSDPKFDHSIVYYAENLA